MTPLSEEIVDTNYECPPNTLATHRGRYCSAVDTKYLLDYVQWLHSWRRSWIKVATTNPNPQILVVVSVPLMPNKGDQRLGPKLSGSRNCLMQDLLRPWIWSGSTFQMIFGLIKQKIKSWLLGISTRRVTVTPRGGYRSAAYLACVHRGSSTWSAEGKVWMYCI